MQIVLLAAGLGTRLGSLTQEIPKALVRVADRSLVAHCLGFCTVVAPREIVVVTGFGADRLRTEVAEVWSRLMTSGPGTRSAVRVEPPTAPPELRLVENRDFRQGNILSLQAARPHLHETFMLMNVDHIYRPAIAAVVRPEADRVTAFIDTDRMLGADDMKVERDPSGRIRRIAKTLERFDCGYVGMTQVPERARAEYFAAVDAALAADGPTIHVERVLARLAETDHAPACRDISGHGWLEVDTPDERSRAEEVLRGKPW